MSTYPGDSWWRLAWIGLKRIYRIHRYWRRGDYHDLHDHKCKWDMHVYLIEHILRPLCMKGFCLYCSGYSMESQYSFAFFPSIYSPSPTDANETISGPSKCKAQPRGCLLWNLHTLWDSSFIDTWCLCVDYSFSWPQPGEPFTSGFQLYNLFPPLTRSNSSHW